MCAYFDEFWELCSMRIGITHNIFEISLSFSFLRLLVIDLFLGTLCPIILESQPLYLHWNGIFRLTYQTFIKFCVEPL